ncbi:MAG: hypothetical protein EPO26_13075 [Chloroflexota bacterium]|nr:MAG: hypothetical protein EPO26_13075 [Chloroflexota bacterium]
MSNGSGFPSLATVQRHAKAGLQDDTYLTESPFLNRKISSVTAAKAQARSPKRIGAHHIARPRRGVADPKTGTINAAHASSSTTDGQTAKA